MADQNPYIGAARAAIGQGLGMGWGDEGEAWLRSKAGSDSYETNLNKIRQEYGQYSKEHPYISGAAEFAGGALPGVAMLLTPGGQVAGAQQLARTGGGALARLAATGAGVGAVSGAGSALEDSRASGAVAGGVIGGALGAALPIAMRGGSGAYNWLKERLSASPQAVEHNAARKMSNAMRESDMTPQQIEATLAQDKSRNIPSVVANANPALVDLAEAVAQRTGKGARKIEDTLVEQKLGSRERTQQQVTKGLQPGDYYDDIANLQQDLRTKAAPHYEAAYRHGPVTDPEVLKFMKLPQFQQAQKEADKLLAAEGRAADLNSNTVETLDHVKRGLDALIEKQTDPVTGKISSLGRVYTQKKNEFLAALDAAVPEYASARAVYRGDAELMDAMRKGINDFGKLDHEQVIKMVGKMSDGEKDAFRTGVARDLYDKIMKPAGNFNAAQRLIGSPEMQAKLQPLFDNPGQFQLFKSSLERESQLFNQANKVLGGSPTGKRMQMRENLEDNSGVGEAILGAATGSWKNSLMNAALGGLRKGQMTEKTATKLSDMLMAKDPHEVASVVKLLEEHAAREAPKAARASAAELGAVTGTASAISPSPYPEEPAVSIEDKQPDLGLHLGPGIED
jgi:hypothetical protein